MPPLIVHGLRYSSHQFDNFLTKTSQHGSPKAVQFEPQIPEFIVLFSTPRPLIPNSIFLALILHISCTCA
jgi:hypothetical protein